VLLVQPVVRRLSGLLVSWLCELATRYDGAQCPTCGQRMRRRGHRPRTVNTWFGPVRLTVTRLRCPVCGTESAPLLERSQLRCGCTPEVWEAVLQEAADHPYRQVEANLARFGIEVSDSTVEALVAEVGQDLGAAEQAAVGALAAGQGPPPVKARAERLYVSVDARSVRVDGQWRELKVGVIYEAGSELDARGRAPRPERLSSFSCFGGVEEFLERFAVELERRGIRWVKEVVILADGADWIWDRLPAMMPLGVRVVQVLDFFHAAENLNKAVVAVHGEGSQTGRALFRELRTMLKLGNRRTILAHLERLLEQAAGEDAQRVVGNVQRYIRRHWERISYLRLRTDGYHLGSGVVESQCKRLGQRVKGPGMNWTDAGLSALLAVDNQCRRLSAEPWPVAA